MNSHESLSDEVRRQIHDWIERLLKASDRDVIVECASNLTRLGIRLRGSIRTRGSLSATAEERLIELDKQRVLAKFLEDSSLEVRCQVALALGEAGGQEASREVAKLLRNDPAEQVKLYCITALRTLGGPDAVDALRQCIDGSDPVAVRNAAIEAIKELATGGAPDLSENALPAKDSSKSVSRGSIRTRGRIEYGPPANVVETISRVSKDVNELAQLRYAARHLLNLLTS